jgi:hypothetical protein
MQPSDEGDSPGLKLARAQGEAFQRTIEHMVQDVAADGGAMKKAGEYNVGYAAEKAEGMYALRDGKLEWQAPTEENIPIEVVVCDGADGRFVPSLTVHATLITADGHEVGAHQQPFLWDPYLYHYGRNWTIPGEGDYTRPVKIDPPEFMRHDEVNGKRYAEPVQVEFTGVHLKTGRE